MSFLAISKKRPVDLPDAEVGMLDVSANALAVLILATMMVLTVAAPPVPRGEIRTDARPDLFYPSPVDLVVTPQTDYWLITEGGITRLDIDAFATGLADGSTLARTSQGEATLIVDRRNYRDLNDHRLLITPDWNAIRTTGTSLTTPEGIATAKEIIQTAYERDAILPTLVVLTEGTESFSDLYWSLRETEVPMRWVPIVEQTQLTLSRRVSNFESRRIKWQ
ncbi:MAG: hypothetical protein VX202_04645 [Pseudomonadota bacterium]|nr:hypothetical protein [Pseudomonadota bacterium]